MSLINEQFIREEAIPAVRKRLPEVEAKVELLGMSAKQDIKTIERILERLDALEAPPKISSPVKPAGKAPKAASKSVPKADKKKSGK